MKLPLFLAAGALGCITMLGPPDGTVEVAAHDSVEVWVAQNAACGTLIPYVRPLHWYLVPGTRFRNPDGRWVLGRFEAPDRIYIAAGRWDDAFVQRHELLHAMWGTGHGGPFIRCRLRIEDYPDFLGEE